MNDVIRRDIFDLLGDGLSGGISASPITDHSHSGFIFHFELKIG
jgi:hypothetical protein